MAPSHFIGLKGQLHKLPPYRGVSARTSFRVEIVHPIPKFVDRGHALFFRPRLSAFEVKLSEMELKYHS